MLDFSLRPTEVSQSFQVGIPTSEGVPDGISDCERSNSDFRDQMECTVSLQPLFWTLIFFIFYF